MPSHNAPDFRRPRDSRHTPLTPRAQKHLRHSHGVRFEKVRAIRNALGKDCYEENPKIDYVAECLIEQMADRGESGPVWKWN